jgi:hypothetical protein
MTLFLYALTITLGPIMLIALIVSFLMTMHRRARPLTAGTAPANFPPGFMPIGAVLTGNRIGLGASLAIETFFTAPVGGIYLVGMCIKVVSTDGTGTVKATLTTTSFAPVSIAQTLTPSEAAAVTAIEQDVDLATPADGYSAMIPVWLSTGDKVRIATVAASLTSATSYNVYCTALRAF